MGLDMYLKAKRWIRHSEPELKNELIKQFEELKSFDAEVVQEISIEGIYWRKANAIHKWFVDHAQKGVDDCGNYYVERSDLIALKEVCDRVLGFKHLAEELLPAANGFFFGSTDYDDGYYSDVEFTSREIEKLLQLPETWSFEYHSSW